MKKNENECVNCPSEIGCLGFLCRYSNAVHYYCDWCKEPDVTLYHYNDAEICADCLLKEFEIVEGSDW